MQSNERTMKLRKHKEKNSHQEFEGLGTSGKGNPFTTPPGYFDGLSSDIMKTVGTVTILALLRTKPLQVAIGVVTTIAVATAIYFFSSDSSKQNNNSSTVNKNYILPDVRLDENAEQPISVVSAEDDNKQIVVVNSDISSERMIQYFNQLPVNQSLKKHLTDEYAMQLASYQTTMNEGPDDGKMLAEVIEINNETEYLIPILSNENSDNAERTLSAFEMLPRDTCSEQSMTLRAQFPGKTTYLWNNGATTPEISVDKSGIYRVSIGLENGKKLSKAVSVKIIPKPSLNNDYLITACTGSILRLSVGQKTGGYQYYWPQYKLSTPQLTVSKPGLYYAQITGCQTYVDSFFVVFTHCELGIPNMITPNGDGISETFSITNLSKYPNTELCIYDKSNKLIYKSLNYQNDWDASLTPDGSYFFILKFTDGSTQEGLITVKH